MHSENRGSSDASGREPLAGLVERVTFHNPDNGFCVLRVKVKEHHELVTLLGAALIGVSSGGNSSHHPALPNTAPQPGVYRYHAGQAASRACRPASSLRSLRIIT